MSAGVGLHGTSSKATSAIPGQRASEHPPNLQALLESERSSALESEADMDTEGFTAVVSQKEKQRLKRCRRATVSPQTVASYADATTKGIRSTGPTGDTGNRLIIASTQPATNQKPPTKQIMIGHSTTSSLKAARVLNIPKAVYCLRNIDSCYTADDVKQYIESLGVRVISCYERTPENSKYADNKSFRICIFQADKSALLSDSSWSSGISIEPWVFKPKNDRRSETGERNDVGANGSRGVGLGSIVPPGTSTSAAQAVVEAGTSQHG